MCYFYLNFVSGQKVGLAKRIKDVKSEARRKQKVVIEMVTKIVKSDTIPRKKSGIEKVDGLILVF